MFQVSGFMRLAGQRGFFKPKFFPTNWLWMSSEWTLNWCSPDWELKGSEVGSSFRRYLGSVWTSQTTASWSTLRCDDPSCGGEIVESNRLSPFRLSSFPLSLATNVGRGSGKWTLSKSLQSVSSARGWIVKCWLAGWCSCSCSQSLYEPLPSFLFSTVVGWEYPCFNRGAVSARRYYCKILSLCNPKIHFQTAVSIISGAKIRNESSILFHFQP